MAKYDWPCGRQWIGLNQSKLMVNSINWEHLCEKISHHYSFSSIFHILIFFFACIMFVISSKRLHRRLWITYIAPISLFFYHCWERYGNRWQTFCFLIRIDMSNPSRLLFTRKTHSTKKYLGCSREAENCRTNKRTIENGCSESDISWQVEHCDPFGR
jgi:hypothetical protein